MKTARERLQELVDAIDAGVVRFDSVEWLYHVRELLKQDELLARFRADLVQET